MKLGTCDWPISGIMTDVPCRFLHTAREATP